MAPGKFQGSTRGIFGLKTWEIPRMPFDVKPKKVLKPQDDQPIIKQNENHMKTQTIANPSVGAVFIAKYTFKGNPESPLGVELSLTPGDKLTFLGQHATQEMWWLVRDKLGQNGYVPASYVANLEELTKVKSMPWLDSQATVKEEDNVVKQPYKKYVSSYEHEEIKQMKLKEFYCEICDKQLNGPHPYRAHMASKGHREIEEYNRENES